MRRNIIVIKYFSLYFADKCKTGKCSSFKTDTHNSCSVFVLKCGFNNVNESESDLSNDEVD